MSGEPNMPDHVLDAVQSLADEMRQRAATGPSRGWYVVFPRWVVARAGGWDGFVEQFEVSHERQGAGHLGVIGFEIPAEGTYLPARQYTMKRYRDEQETPE